jgi:DNA-binding protein H-NS
MSKKPTKQELIDYVESLVAKCEELTRERDEARREVMSWISDQACRFEDVDEEYKKRGWEYLKENTDA